MVELMAGIQDSAGHQYQRDGLLKDLSGPRWAVRRAVLSFDQHCS
jgi:hypothetical protein